jgi:hypothetical protein
MIIPLPGVEAPGMNAALSQPRILPRARQKIANDDYAILRGSTRNN